MVKFKAGDEVWSPIHGDGVVERVEEDGWGVIIYAEYNKPRRFGWVNQHAKCEDLKYPPVYPRHCKPDNWPPVVLPDLKVDTPVWVRNTDRYWIPAHFCSWQGTHMRVWRGRTTSHTAVGLSFQTEVYEHWKLNDDVGDQ